MIEGMAQTAGVHRHAVHRDRPADGGVFPHQRQMQVPQARRPGDVIEYHMRLVTRRRDMWWFHGDAKVNGEIVAQADVGAMLAD